MGRKSRIKLETTHQSEEEEKKTLRIRWNPSTETCSVAEMTHGRAVIRFSFGETILKMIFFVVVALVVVRLFGCPR